METPSSIRGRGAGFNPAQRFAELRLDYDPGEAPEKIATSTSLRSAS